MSNAKVIMTPVVTAMRCIVSDVNKNILPYLKTQDSSIQQVNYLYGHWIEVSATLQEMSQHKNLRYQKFPLVLLIEDLPIDMGRGDYNKTTLQMLICHHTEPNFKSEQRQKEIFDKIIVPVYEELMTQICKSGYFVENNERKIPRRIIDRKYLGREGVYGSEANIALQYLDARQIQNMELNINKAFCFSETTF